MDGVTVGGVTEVIVGSGLPTPLLPDRPGRRQAVVMTQPSVRSLADEIGTRLGAEGIAAEVIELPDRDAAKTLRVAESVYESLARLKLTREDTIIGVGGGAVTDLAGYVAGTWLRGIEAVHIPTTLLGAVDASIGGKTGVNLAGKNLVGVIWHPSRVIVDIAVLRALPEALLAEGMAEALKAGLIGDSGLFEVISARGLEAPLDDVVRRAVAVKVAIVTRDPFEQGERAHLNFGHTIGHAVEFASPLSHGESVAVGMIAASAVSERVLGFKHLERVNRAVEGLGLASNAEDVDVDRVKGLLQHDKKRDGAGMRMVLLREIEDPVLYHVDQDDLAAGLAAVGLRAG